MVRMVLIKSMGFRQEVSTICNGNPHLNLQFYYIKAMFTKILFYWISKLSKIKTVLSFTTEAYM